MNLLVKIQKAQSLYHLHKNEDITDRTIYMRYIKKEFNIGLSTYRLWLGVNVESQKKELNLNE